MGFKLLTLQPEMTGQTVTDGMAAICGGSSAGILHPSLE